MKRIVVVVLCLMVIVCGFGWTQTIKGKIGPVPDISEIEKSVNLRGPLQSSQENISAKSADSKSVSKLRSQIRLMSKTIDAMKKEIDSIKKQQEAKGWGLTALSLAFILQLVYTLFIKN